MGGTWVTSTHVGAARRQMTRTYWRPGSRHKAQVVRQQPCCQQQVSRSRALASGSAACLCCLVVSMHAGRTGTWHARPARYRGAALHTECIPTAAGAGSGRGPPSLPPAQPDNVSRLAQGELGRLWRVQQRSQMAELVWAVTKA